MPRKRSLIQISEPRIRKHSTSLCYSQLTENQEELRPVLMVLEREVPPLLSNDLSFTGGRSEEIMKCMGLGTRQDGI